MRSERLQTLGQKQYTGRRPLRRPSPQPGRGPQVGQKNMSATLRHKPPLRTTDTQTIFRKLKAPTIGEKANVRRQPNTRDRPRAFHPSGAQQPFRERQPVRDTPPWDRQRSQRGQFNAAWPTLPNRSGGAANVGRYGDQHADFSTTRIHNITRTLTYWLLANRVYSTVTTALCN